MNKSQSFYIDEKFGKLSVEQIAIDLEVGVDAINEYLVQRANKERENPPEDNASKKKMGVSIMTPSLAQIYDQVAKPKNNTANEHITTTKPQQS